MHIAIIGPANPDEFSGDLDGVDTFPKGMGGTPVNCLVRSLLDLGHTVSLFTGTAGGDIWRARGAQLSIVAVPYRQRARDRALDFFRHERRAIARELSECGADVYHAHWTYEFAMACVDAQVSPLVVTAHDAPFAILRQMPDSYRLIRAMMAIRTAIATEHLVAVSPYLAASWRKQMAYIRPIAVITNPLPRLDLPIVAPPDHPVILDVANSSALKNVKVLLAAFSSIRITRPDSELRLVGDGLARGEALETWARSNLLSDGVSFLGKLNRSDLARQYAEATVFCHASRQESQGVSLIEAMSARIPIVAGRDSGAVAWTLFDGAGGSLVDINRPNAIAAAIESILANYQAAADRADVAEAMMRSRYEADVIAAQYVAEYKRLVDRGAAGPVVLASKKNR